ncbi:MAG: type II secretion system protein [Candidatus Paceibacterota bacterium]
MFKKVKAFTLIELLVTIAIVGILSGFIFISMSSALNAAKDAKRQADLATIQKAVLEYYAEHTAYPYTATTTACNLCTSDSCSNPCTGFYANIQPYLPNIPTDPTGTYYTYTYSATPKFVLQATLSSGFAYKYDSLSGFSTATPFVGPCSGNVQGTTGLACAENTASGYTINQFTYVAVPGSYSWTIPSGITSIEYLVVAGGGGGGYGGGGGGGGFRTGTYTVAEGNVVTITVGKGGTGSNSAPTSGSNSVFGITGSAITSNGGGAGGVTNTAGSPGGSGGGGGVNSTIAAYAGGAGNTPATSPSQGNNGGNTTGVACSPAGGGGGAGAAGGPGNSSGPGVGGVGAQSSITGTATYYAGGGGGDALCNYGSKAGGNGGGGNNGQPGVDGLGGGGGAGGRDTGYTGKNGGSGIIIIKYITPS